MIKLNLGSGRDYKEGYTNIEVSKRHKADLYHDLSLGIPFNDNSVDEVIAKHFIEHLSDTIFIMNEIWRVCKNNAKVIIEVPHQSNLLAYADPTHKRIFNEESFNYFCSNGEHYWAHEDYGIKCDFYKVSDEVKLDKRHGYVKVELVVVKLADIIC